MFAAGSGSLKTIMSPAPVTGAGFSLALMHDWLGRGGVEPVIPQRSDQFRRRGVTAVGSLGVHAPSAGGRCVGWLKENCRIGTC